MRRARYLAYNVRTSFVYKIPYRHARAWPRPSASREQRYLAYKDKLCPNALKIKCMVFDCLDNLDVIDITTENNSMLTIKGWEQKIRIKNILFWPINYNLMNI